jgi:hypothetical protein
MIQMPMRQPYTLQRQAKVVKRAHKLVDIPARIDEGRVVGGGIPNERAVLLERRDGHEPYLQLGFRGRFRGSLSHTIFMSPFFVPRNAAVALERDKSIRANRHEFYG